MLTGDKVETAICIAISTSLKARSQRLFVMEGSLVEKKQVVFRCFPIAHKNPPSAVSPSSCMFSFGVTYYIVYHSCV